MIQKIVPFLMYRDRLGEAVAFYASIFGNTIIKRLDKDAEGNVFSAVFTLEGQDFYAFNGGSHFHFSEGFSLFISCTTQEDVDRLWEQLSEGGEKSMCGWVKDKFGLSWQIIPTQLMELFANPDPEVASYARNAMLGMRKIIIADLTRKP